MPKIVGITGFISSGKDTAADYLCKHHGFKKLSFAGTLKDAVSAVFGWDRNLVDGTTEESRAWREDVDEWWAKRLDIPHLTPRWVLQQWGTEVCRVNFHNDIWVASVENQLRKITHNVVLTDCRFINEVNAIKNAGGTTVRIERGARPAWYQHAILFNQGPDTPGWSIAKQRLESLGAHASEYSSVGLDYDLVIENNGTIEDLQRKIASVVNL